MLYTVNKFFTWLKCWAYISPKRSGKVKLNKIIYVGLRGMDVVSVITQHNQFQEILYNRNNFFGNRIGNPNTVLSIVVRFEMS